MKCDTHHGTSLRYVPNGYPAKFKKDLRNISRIIARTSLVIWTDVRIDSRRTDDHTDRWRQATTIPQRPFGWGVKAMGCPNFNCGLVKLPLKLWYGQEITCHDFTWTIIYPWQWISVGLSKLCSICLLYFLPSLLPRQGISTEMHGDISYNKLTIIFLPLSTSDLCGLQFRCRPAYVHVCRYAR